MQAQREVKESLEQAGSFFDNLFGGANAGKGSESPKVEAPAALPPTSKPSAPKPAAPAAQKEAGGRGVTDKRAAAVAAALKNLGAVTGKAAVDDAVHGIKEEAAGARASSSSVRRSSAVNACDV